MDWGVCVSLSSFTLSSFMPRSIQTGWDRVTGAPMYGARSRHHSYSSYSRATQDPNYFVQPISPDLNHPFVATAYNLDSAAYRLSQSPSLQPNWNNPSGVIPYRSQTNQLSASRSLWHRIRLWRHKEPPGPTFHSSPPPLNPRKREPLTIHSLLASNLKAKSPVFLFNISQPPTDALIWHVKRYMPLQADRRPIISAPDARCLLTFTHDALSGHVLDVSGMTLEDLLWELYDFFQAPLTAYELRSPGVYENAVRAMERRCAAAFNPENEWARGLRRVDCLGQRIYFKGVRVEVDANGGACLSVSFMKRDL